MAARRHSYTIEQANALIPQVRAVLLQLAMEKCSARSGVIDGRSRSVSFVMVHG